MVSYTLDSHGLVKSLPRVWWHVQTSFLIEVKCWACSSIAIGWLVDESSDEV